MSFCGSRYGSGGKRGVAFAAAVLLTLGCGCAAEARSKPEPASAPAALDDEASLRIARAMRAAGDPAASIRIYRELTAQSAPDAPLKLELGDALLEANLIDDAIGVYGAAPRSGRAQIGMARVQLALDRPEKALGFADRAAALAPHDLGVLIGRGVVLDRVGRHADAQASYRAALAEAPRSVAARTDLALSLALSGRCEEAVEILEPIARSATATPQDRQNLAFVYGLKGDAAAARSLGRVDLDEATAAGNAAFLAAARTRLSSR